MSDDARTAVRSKTRRGIQEDDRDPPAWRIETAHLRQTPDFIIIGTQRGGTTSLYRYLTAHPEVGAAFRKEVHYFDRYYEKGRDWYLAHFPERGEFPIVGEASPYYLFHPEAPERVRAEAPNARLIALLRNPVDRAYSQYHMKVARGLESLPFAEAIDREPDRLAADRDPLGPAWRHHTYLARGAYAKQLRRWLAHFPREQLLILQSEAFYAAPERTLHETQAFLGLRPSSPGAFKVFHEADYAEMEAGLRRCLRDYFAPLNAELYDLVGVDFGWEDDSSAGQRTS
jgi:hypothetical protein